MYDTCGSAYPPTCDKLSPECTKECNAGIDQGSHMRMGKGHLCKRNTSPLLDELNNPGIRNFLLILRNWQWQQLAIYSAGIFQTASNNKSC